MRVTGVARSVPGELFYAPWRADPRPIIGLLHGTYAFVGVAGFWRGHRHVAGPRALFAHTEFARWREAAREAAGTLLGSGRLAPPGTTFVTGMAEQLAEWCAEPVPAEAGRRARRLSDDHRTRWRRLVSGESAP